MQNYIVERKNDEYNVVELKERKVILTANSGKVARKKAHSLNGGGGFNGDTPNFFHKVVASDA